MKRAIRILLIVALMIGLIYVAYKAIGATVHAVDRTEHDTVMEIGRDAINHYKYDEYKRNQAIASEFKNVSEELKSESAKLESEESKIESEEVKNKL